MGVVVRRINTPKQQNIHVDHKIHSTNKNTPEEQNILKLWNNKKLSYCWETVRRESMPRIAEMDVEMTT